MSKSFIVLACFATASTFTRAEDQTAANKSDVPDSQLNINGIFNSPLPGTEKKFTLRLNVHPHAGDLINRDFLRTTIGLRYGVGKDLEVSTETDAYFAHGLGHKKFFESSGFGNVRLGAKYHIGEKLWHDWDTAIGATLGRPVGHPPPEITDGLQHFAPYITFARPWKARPGLRYFWGVGADLVSETSIAGSHEKNDLRDDSVIFTTGLVWDREPVHYTFETALETTRGIGHTDEDVIVIRPGIVWEIPRRFTFNSRGQWLFGLGCHVSNGPDGVGFGVSGKLRLSFDFKGWWRRLTHRGSSSPSSP